MTGGVGAAQASMGSTQQTAASNQARNAPRLDSRSIERKAPKQKMQLDSSTMMANVSNEQSQIERLSHGTENTPSKQSHVSQTHRNKRYSSGQQKGITGQDEHSVGMLASNNMSANSSQKQSLNSGAAAQSHRIGHLNKRNNMIISSNFEAH